MTSAAFANSKTARIASVVVQLAGLALIIYWSLQLVRQSQYIDAYRYDAATIGNPLLTPAYRFTLEALALVAGGLMLFKSKWALVPYALHFAAYLCLLFSITGYAFDWRFYPLSALLILLSQVVLLLLLLWLEKQKLLTAWPLQS